MLNQTVFSNPASPLRDHLWVYIADNGRTLVADDIRGWAGCGAARLLPNPNTGGAGGFSRCILEALSDKDRFGLTHIILMDDDIEFTHEDVERVYAFLRLLKHDRVALGAAMTALDTPWEQVSFGEQFNPLGRITLRKSGINLTRLSSLIRNTVDVPVNYCSWWFCCVPLAVFQASPQDARSDNYDAANMPLPIFVQYDDIEWSVRNAELEKAHLFGVYIRHEAFGKKRGGWKDYYSMRNSLILAALHERRLFNRVGKAYFFFVSFVKILHRIALFRYRDAELLMRAVEDYSQGLERIGAENAEALLVDVRSYAAMKTPVSLFRSLSLIGRLARLILSFAPRAGHIAARYREDAARCVTGGFWRAYLGRNDAL
jgi:GT2 family glycosyltransferase